MVNQIFKLDFIEKKGTTHGLNTLKFYKNKYLRSYNNTYSNDQMENKFYNVYLE